MSRRVLLAAGASALAGLTGTPQAQDAGRRFDLTGPPEGLIWRKPLDTLKAGRPVALSQAEQPPGLGTFQGYTLYQDHIYLLDGDAYGPANPAPGNTHLTSVSLLTGQKVERRFTAAAKSLDHREPEGMAIQIAGGQPRLCYGLAAGRPEARLVSIVYKSKLV
ncbi:hypothetical protein AB0K48_45735 [Nonomuraea sp. NPDC055795]